MLLLLVPYFTLSLSGPLLLPLQICRVLELSRVERDQHEAVPLPPSWAIQDESKMMTLLVTTILKCYLSVSRSGWE